jgi:hypothetical protein
MDINYINLIKSLADASYNYALKGVCSFAFDDYNVTMSDESGKYEVKIVSHNIETIYTDANKCNADYPKLTMLAQVVGEVSNLIYKYVRTFPAQELDLYPQKYVTESKVCFILMRNIKLFEQLQTAKTSILN